jgi:RNA polymerase sigma factor (sigma-70 family)
VKSITHPGGQPARLFSLGLRRARRSGLPEDLADECASAFVARMLRQVNPIAPAGAAGCGSSAYLLQCADNFVRNYCRSLARRRQHETGWPAVSADDGSLVLWEVPSDAAQSPTDCLLRAEFWERVFAAVEQLKPIQREVFLRHHLRGEPVQELARSLGLDSNAVAQLLFRTRRRLRFLLEQAGLTEAELRGYAAPPPRPPASLRFVEDEDGVG